ncbi:beta strand repeat-containing protein [Singulisphaera sp. PoT]|uniref:beta strand repeat-containing protein n=1 Tax=Singulisphaera sp. PoT TaxID=3411797 RepID=UPI003BF4EBC2
MNASTFPRRRRLSRNERLRRSIRPDLLELEGRINLSNLISVTGSSAPEGDTGSTPYLTYTVHNAGDDNTFLGVTYKTVDGTAKAGVDYTATTGMVKLDNRSPASFSILGIGNQILQGNRSYSAVLTSLVNLADPKFAQLTSIDFSDLISSGDNADFNGDGKPDMVLGISSADAVSVLLNTTAAGATTATFAPGVAFDAGSGTSTKAVAIGDFNGDGKPDIAVANDTAGTVSILINTTAAGATTPSFAPYAEFATGSSPSTLAVGDLNQDGKVDLVVGNAGSNNISVLLNTTAAGATTPSFAPKSDVAIDGGPSSIAIGDLNTDGKPDLVVAVPDSRYFSVLLSTTAQGATSATFGPRTDYFTDNNTSPISVAIGDLNTDGKPDIAVINRQNPLSLVTSNLQVFMNSTTSGATSLALTSQMLDQYVKIGPVKLQDINGDGLTDITVLAEGRVEVLRNITAPGAKTATFGARTETGLGASVVDFSIGDFNGDGKPDFAAIGGADTPLLIALNTTPFLTASINNTPATGTILDDDDPIFITYLAGTNQSATINTNFGTNLNVFLRNAAGNLVQGGVVTYTAPSSGASGTFAGGGTTYQVASASSGQAPAIAFKANGEAGTYSVTATVAGHTTQIHFNQTNLKVSPVFTDLKSVSIEYGTDSTTLSGHFAAGLNVPEGRTITISIGSHDATAIVGANGNFSTTIDTASINASDTPYTVTYTFAGDSTYDAAIDHSTTLTIALRNLSIYANPIIKTYGDAYTFTGDEYLAVGLINSDTISKVTLASAGASGSANVSSIPNISGPPYAIVPSDAEGDGLSNYKITYVNGGMTVVPRHIQGSFTAADKAYDGNTNATVVTRSTIGDLGGVSLVGGVASFDDPNVGDDKTVRLAGATLSGSGALNYILDSVLPATADITGAIEPGQISMSGSSAPSTFGQAASFTASLNFDATGQVTFHDGNNVIETANIVGGKATISPTNLGVGGHQIWASYDDISSDPLFHIVNRAGSITSVTASPAVSNFGQQVTFTATVNAGATGAVLFYDGSTPLGQATISGNTATFNYTAPQAGTHDIRAIYVGDFNYLASTSAPLTQVINLVQTTTSISAALTPGSNGQTVTLQANVAGGATGAVIFFDGSRILGTGEINGSTATLVTARSQVSGNGFFRAVYSGNTTYLGSVSSGVSLPATPTTGNPIARMGFVPQFQQMATRFNPRGIRFPFNRR